MIIKQETRRQVYFAHNFGNVHKNFLDFVMQFDMHILKFYWNILKWPTVFVSSGKYVLCSKK